MGRQLVAEHVGVVVDDLERAVDWYCRALGCTVVWREPDTDVDDLAIGLPGEVVRLRGAMLDLGGVWFELHQYLSVTGEGQRRVCDTGLGHLAFRTTQIQAEWDRLERLGVQWNASPSKIIAGPLKGRSWVYGIDPFGVVIELCQDDRGTS